MMSGPNNLLAIARQPRKEDVEQSEVISWAKLHTERWPVLSYLLSIPNEAKRSDAQALRIYRMGRRSGPPDLLLPAPIFVLRYAGFACEMKREGEKSRPEQRDWQDGLEVLGWRVIRDAQASRAIAELQSYAELFHRHWGAAPLPVQSWHTAKIQARLRKGEVCTPSTRKKRRR